MRQDIAFTERDGYDAIIVGGRPAGASLAARLGQRGWRVLLLDRATFPSPPAVSYPAIFAASMRLLDEIGVHEADYAHGTPPLRWWINEFRDDFRTFSRIPDLYGRDYAYAIDRARFDDALWRNAQRFPSVTATQSFVVTDLLWRNERVVGIRGRHAGGPEQVFRADCVIDAGGRFSIVARKAGAQTVEEHRDFPTTVYYAYWSHAEPYDESARPVVHVYTRGNGFGFLLMDGADGQLGVGIYGQSALLANREEKVEEEYTRLLREEPRVWRRLRTAQRVTDVRGMRDIANRYRTPGGPGWALVGDALHHVDPMSAQGIYDALSGAKVLSQALGEWKRGAMSWQQAIAHYGATIEAETRPHYAATLARIRREIFTLRPDWAWKSYVRWVADDPSYRRSQALTMARGVEATNRLTSGLLARAILRGAAADLARFATGEPRPNALPPLRSGHLAASTLPLMLQCDP